MEQGSNEKGARDEASNQINFLAAMQGFDKEIIINAMAKMMDNLFRGDNLRNVKMSTIIQVTKEGLFEVKKSRRDANGSRNNIGQ